MNRPHTYEGGIKIAHIIMAVEPRRQNSQEKVECKTSKYLTYIKKTVFDSAFIIIKLDFPLPLRIQPF